MKNFIKSLTRRQKIGAVVAIMGIFLFFAGTLIHNNTVAGLYDQNGAKRWSSEGEYTQLSCFFPVGNQPDEYFFLSVGHTLEEKLKEASIEAEGDARVYVDAYSVTGKLTIDSEYGTIDLQTVGVTDDFFLFHPVNLSGGAYFNDDMLMKDGILIDEDAAWRLYGSNDVVGMTVTINAIPFYIRGVVDREEGRFAEAAGLDASLCYVSLETLQKHGIINGSYTYEIIMPNPVEGFALKHLKEAVNADEENCVVLENSTRFSIGKLWAVFQDGGIRSMSRHGIVFPYWENIARANEDVLAGVCVFRLFGLIVCISLLLFYGYGKWKNRTWTFKSIIKKIKGRIKNEQI